MSADWSAGKEKSRDRDGKEYHEDGEKIVVNFSPPARGKGRNASVEEKQRDFGQVYVEVEDD